MVDRQELDTLIAKARSTGAIIHVAEDETGYPAQITVRGLPGIGPYPMSPIAAAERLREALN